MIIVKESSLLTATKAAFNSLYESDSVNISDPEVWKEEPAALEVINTQNEEISFELKNDTLFYIKDYLKYFPEIDPDLSRIEQEHYTNVVIKEGHLTAIELQLRENLSSRRALVNTWSPVYYDNSIGGVCVTQLYFRVRNGNLEAHSHLRANDAYRLLLMDMQLAIWMQHEMATRLNLPKGKYIHFVDALHIYKKYEEQINRQYQFMKSSEVWQ